MKQVPLVSFSCEPQGLSDLGDGSGVKGAHRLEEWGGFGLGGIGSQMETAQHGQRAARVTLSGGEVFWNCQCSLSIKGWTSDIYFWRDFTYKDTGQTWKGLLLEYAQMQQGAYCVRCSGRQEELNDLFAVFGHKIFTLLCVACGNEVTDLLHELHQSFLQGSNGKALMRNFLVSFVYFNNTTYLCHIGWQQSLQFLDDEQAKSTSGV